ncbi:T9SS type A sorting domain-containing protein [Psychroserpens sp. XS_ASV72]|uniref:DUF7619 domain-containing protein n=1 Tax=Psychroserpens sp. XS_ASV72 TaxID=3241293 RepID=UPI0035113ED8
MIRILLLLLFTSLFCQAQIVNIPDANFKAALIDDGVDTNMDGEIQESEASQVTILNVSYEGISDMTGLSSFSSLTELFCINNNISELDLSGNPLLERIDCGWNSMDNLDISQNFNIKFIYCGSNSISQLDLTGKSQLITLYCGDNSLTELDTSDCISLQMLDCGTLNLLTSLDFSQNPYLIELDCSGNPFLTELNLKNGTTFNDIQIDGNNLEFICVDQEELDYIQSLAGTSTIVTSYCTFQPGGLYNTITGQIVFDSNDDGCNASDATQAYITLEINDGVYQEFTSTGSDGTYFFYPQDGNFDISLDLENSTWFNVSPATATIPFANTDNNVAIQDFCVSPNGIHNDVEIVIVPTTLASPGFDATYQVVFVNKGNQVISGDFELNYDDSVLDYVSSSQSPNTIDTGQLVWSYSNLLPFESRSITVTLNVNAPTETPPVNNGDELAFTAVINPVSGDENPGDNTFDLKQIVVGSYDPNDITCLEGATVDSSMIGDYLHYNIRFENTGTAAATFVVVTNDIDEMQYDLSTLQILNASHEMSMQTYGNKVEFVFDAINLMPNAQGNVLYKIKSLNSLQVNDEVSQQANIFFDYNFPIETNMATTAFETLSINDFSFDNTFKLYPNPAQSQIRILGKTTIEKVKIYDLHGRLTFSKLVHGMDTIMDVSSLNDGVYFVNIIGNAGEEVQKLIVN